MRRSRSSSRSPSRSRRWRSSQSDDSRRRDLEESAPRDQVHANGQLTYQFVDPSEAPGYAQQLGVREPRHDRLLMGNQKQTLSGTAEADLTSGILKLVQPNPRKAYFTIGHEERRTDGFDQEGLGQLKTQLESRNFMTDTLNLFTTPEVPADASVVVIAGPQRPFSPRRSQRTWGLHRTWRQSADHGRSRRGQWTRSGSSTVGA